MKKLFLLSFILTVYGCYKQHHTPVIAQTETITIGDDTSAATYTVIRGSEDGVHACYTVIFDDSTALDYLTANEVDSLMRGTG